MGTHTSLETANPLNLKLSKPLNLQRFQAVAAATEAPSDAHLPAETLPDDAHAPRGCAAGIYTYIYMYIYAYKHIHIYTYTQIHSNIYMETNK